jgi:hypothetical protein
MAPDAAVVKRRLVGRHIALSSASARRDTGDATPPSGEFVGISIIIGFSSFGGATD